MVVAVVVAGWLYIRGGRARGKGRGRGRVGWGEWEGGDLNPCLLCWGVYRG